MRKIILIILIVFLIIQSVVAIRINEFELNPEGDDSGNEWVELYHWDEIDLTGYKLVNNDGGEIELSGIFDEFYVYVFEKQWLDNKDEKIFLYKGEELIDETSLDYDSQNDARTLQYCSGEWVFEEGTKGEENNCGETEEESEEEINKEQQENLEKLVEITGAGIKNIELEKIELNPKNIKTENGSENLEKDKYSKYGIIFFCVLLCFLFILKKRKFRKNEFR